MNIPKYLIDVMQEIANGRKLSTIARNKGLDYKKVTNQISIIRSEHKIKSLPHLTAEMIRRKLIS